MSQQRRFRVRLSQVRAENLPSKDRQGASDPYFVFDFDNFKSIKSEVVKKELHPQWAIDVHFYYETRYVNRFKDKTLRFDIYDHDRFFKADDYIGGCELDLHTVAVGFVQHEIVLRGRKKEPVGKLFFSLEMDLWEDITGTFKDLMLQLYEENTSPEPRDKYLQIFYEKDRVSQENVMRTDSVRNRNASWGDTPSLIFNSKLYDFKRLGLRVNVVQTEGNLLLGQGWIPPQVALASNNSLQPFRIAIAGASNMEVGVLEGYMYLKNLPAFGQRPVGVHTDTGPIYSASDDGLPLALHSTGNSVNTGIAPLPPPKDFITSAPSSLSRPTPSVQSPYPATYPISHHHTNSPHATGAYPVSNGSYPPATSPYPPANAPYPPLTSPYPPASLPAHPGAPYVMAQPTAPYPPMAMAGGGYGHPTTVPPVDMYPAMIPQQSTGSSPAGSRPVSIQPSGRPLAPIQSPQSTGSAGAFPMLLETASVATGGSSRPASGIYPPPMHAERPPLASVYPPPSVAMPTAVYPYPPVTAMPMPSGGSYPPSGMAMPAPSAAAAAMPMPSVVIPPRTVVPPPRTVVPPPSRSTASPGARAQYMGGRPPIYPPSPLPPSHMNSTSSNGSETAAAATATGVASGVASHGTGGSFALPGAFPVSSASESAASSPKVPPYSSALYPPPDYMVAGTRAMPGEGLVSANTTGPASVYPNGTGQVYANGTGQVYANTTGPVYANTTGPVYANTTGPASVYPPAAGSAGVYPPASVAGVYPPVSAAGVYPPAVGVYPPATGPAGVYPPAAAGVYPPLASTYPPPGVPYGNVYPPP
ncbi:hypothetical protein AMAG_01878 [Allomyces macrogynus ATCC 38327]|uniref:C2 domain-containing protein n=1 Tax=Allomyces macrogynus (strain ATCC 38327) TaxID=578462 RepID=A0A0L0S103_ALLM3|nr:hypothetical protein AMAG_01878 [Allomyces macrogynus ATCC 38327]|eukprot:KNE56034.1 hypothetical protein AMAG_01878 [Allomyces macrogynus ATCC 38327]